MLLVGRRDGLGSVRVGFGSVGASKKNLSHMGNGTFCNYPLSWPRGGRCRRCGQSGQSKYAHLALSRRRQQRTNSPKERPWDAAPSRSRSRSLSQVEWSGGLAAVLRFLRFALCAIDYQNAYGLGWRSHDQGSWPRLRPRPAGGASHPTTVYVTWK